MKEMNFMKGLVRKPGATNKPGQPPAGQPQAGEEEGRRWYVVQAHARVEHCAQAHIQAQGFETFLPRVQRTIRHARQLRTVLAAAFPGYLFVQLDLRHDPWRSINGTIGVVRMIMGQSQPLAVPRGVVEAIRSYVDASGVARFDRDLTEGQRVRVKLGPLAQSIGELMQLDGNGRARVLLDIMGGKVQTKLSRAALEAV